MEKHQRTSLTSRTQGGLAAARWQGFIHCYEERRHPSRLKPARTPRGVR